MTVLQKSNKSKKKWFGKQKHLGLESTSSVTVTVPPLPQHEEVNLNNVENEQSEHAYSVVDATAVAAEAAGAAGAADAAAHAAAEVVQLTTVTRFAGKSKEEVAAIKIQTAFRGYLVCVTPIFCLFPCFLSLFPLSLSFFYYCSCLVQYKLNL